MVPLPSAERQKYGKQKEKEEEKLRRFIAAPRRQSLILSIRVLRPEKNTVLRP